MLEGLDHVALVVRDVDASAEWYAATLGLEHIHADVWPVPVVMAAHGTGVALFPARPDADQAPPGTLGMAHCAFRAGRAAFDGYKESLTARGVAWEEQDHGIARSIYFTDPDGHRLEITTYEV